MRIAHCILEPRYSGAEILVLGLVRAQIAAGVVGVSPASIRNYRRLITEKVETRLIPNGVDFESVRSAAVHRDEVRKRVYEAAPGEVILLQVGRISPQKQQRLSVEALAALGRMTSLDNIRLVFAGMVEYKAYHLEVEAAARALGVSNRIQFLGSRNDIPLLLAGADAHLMPSAWEAQGIVALEALASGVYCFFTPLEAFSSFNGMSGVAILPEKSDGAQFAGLLAGAIRTSATSSRHLREMESYGFERCAQEYLRLAESLKSGKRGKLSGQDAA